VNASGDIVAIIPARGGSKRVPAKNVLPIAGRPLVAHSIAHARASRCVTETIVSTDDPSIADIAVRNGAAVVRRPTELASDSATSESALLHVLDDRCARGLDDPELVVFLQATSPVRRRDDIDQAVATLRAAEADSLFSATENKHFLWSADGVPKTLNYNFRMRPREQDMDNQVMENGSIYVFKPEVLRRDGNRLGGLIAVYAMDFWSSFQLDSPEHAELLDWILARPDYASDNDWPRLELVVFDFDGVMTDNTVLVGGDGDEAVYCHRGDGWGIARLRDAGVPMLVLSTETHGVVAARCAKLGIECVQGLADKAAALRKLTAEREIDLAYVAYVGNDVNDLECLESVGLPVAVADADPEVRAAARVLLSRPGGHGAVREFCDRVLERLA
jgi:YrbI family 3-deoxy-D-manno-octulosonate 8-phosphate phosphatase